MSARPRRTAAMMRSSSAISSSEAFSGSLWRASSTACLSVINEKYPFRLHAASCGTALVSSVSGGADKEQFVGSAVPVDGKVSALPAFNHKRIFEEVASASLSLNHFVSRFVRSKYLFQALAGHGAYSTGSWAGGHLLNV